MEDILKITGLRKEYPDFVLKDISLNLPCGYIMGLIGPNGSGKTTIIKLIMNLIQKQSGNISIFGLDHVLFEDQIKERIGFVYEVPEFYGSLKLHQTVAILAPFYKNWDHKLFLSYCQKYQIPLDRKFKHLSKGEKMKFSITLALSHQADLLILDEPTSGLDPVFRREFLFTLADILQDEGKSVLYSTHITSDLDRVADYVTLVQNGMIKVSDSKDNIINNWGIIKTDRSFSLPSGIDIKGKHAGQYGVEILTSDINKAKKLLPGEMIVERARLEDIMFLINKGEKND